MQLGKPGSVQDSHLNHLEKGVLSQNRKGWGIFHLHCSPGSQGSGENQPGVRKAFFTVYPSQSAEIRAVLFPNVVGYTLSRTKEASAYI